MKGRRCCPHRTSRSRISLSHRASRLVRHLRLRRRAKVSLNSIPARRSARPHGRSPQFRNPQRTDRTAVRYDTSSGVAGHQIKTFVPHPDASDSSRSDAGHSMLRRGPVGAGPASTGQRRTIQPAIFSRCSGLDDCTSNDRPSRAGRPPATRSSRAPAVMERRLLRVAPVTPEASCMTASTRRAPSRQATRPSASGPGSRQPPPRNEIALSALRRR